MTPNIVTLSNVEVFVAAVVLIVFAVATVCLWVSYANEKRRRLFEQEMHRRRLVQLERCVDMYRERDRLEAVVRRQVDDRPAVTLPVTHCERLERRRRFLPLEDSSHAAR
jgi:hypothetical protein